MVIGAGARRIRPRGADGARAMPRCSASLWPWGLKRKHLRVCRAFGDLVLTCGSEKSRNFRYGMALGGPMPISTQAPTVEGWPRAARAVARLARDRGVDMPITRMVAAVLDGMLTLTEAKGALLARPLTLE